MSERSFKDWEALSAYLDGALPPRERARLEARLADDPALRQALVELRALRAALRDLPPPRVPRNFTLRPEGITPRPRWAGWWRWATALTALLLALVALAHWGLGGIALQEAPPPQVALAPEQKGAAFSEVGPTETVEAPLALAPAPAAGRLEVGKKAAVEPTIEGVPLLYQGTPLAATPSPTFPPVMPSRSVRPAGWRVLAAVLLGLLVLLLAGRRWLLRWGRRDMPERGEF